MSQMHSIFQLTEGDARHGGRVLEFICSSYTKKKAEELLPELGEGFYYILPCYEVRLSKEKT